MKKSLIAAGIFCLTAFAACEPDRRTAQNEGYQDEETTTTVDQQDRIEDNTREFSINAASGSMMEVELGKLAQEKGTMQEVKEFGSMMVQDHSQANERLMAIAQNKNIQLPTNMKQEHREKVERLRSLSGQEFDREYVNLMVEDHQEDVNKFEDMQDQVQDQEIKQWVDNTLQTLRQHKERIDQIKNNMKTQKA